MSLTDRSKVISINKSNYKCPDCGNAKEFIKVFYDIRKLVMTNQGTLEKEIEPIDVMSVDEYMTCGKCYHNFYCGSEI